MNLGIDFGSTYSMFSIYDETNDIVKALELTEGGSKYVPTIACIDDDDNLITGQQAKTFLAEQHDMLPYRAFKMLLGETSPDVLAERGFADISPREISKAFLEHHIKLALNGQKEFNHVVICVPEVWNRELINMSSKTILRDICQKSGLMKTVTVVSEPAAASAFFAYNYKKEHGKNYDGCFLIVDYGGGTLDLTLTKVNTITDEAGNSSIEIDVIGQTGAGENHAGQVGNAGIAYMEGVVRLAMQDAGLITQDTAVECDGYFLSTLNMLEAALMANAQKIADVLEDYSYDPQSLAENTDIFKTLKYHGKKVPVTYSALYRAYQQVISPVLDEQINAIHKIVIQHTGVDPTKAASNGLKIALVGGFGKYAMVQRQIYEKYHIANPEEDAHLVHMSLGEREGAISFGAALIANGIVKLRKTAKQSFGLVSTYGGKETFDYAITYHQELKYDTVYYCRNHPDPAFPDRDAQPFYYTRGTDSEFPVKFAIGINDNHKEAHWLIPLPEIRKLLGNIPTDYYACGFSMDESGVYTFYISPIKNGKPAKEAMRYELGSFRDAFGAFVRLDESNLLIK